MKTNLVNTLWVFLFILSGCIAFWFSALAVKGAWEYLRLDSKVLAVVEKWEVIEENPSSYSLLAKYHFTASSGKEYEGETLFCEPCYLNRFAAEADLKQMKNFSWEAWYSSKNPKASTLQKFFPFKCVLYALLSIGVFIYFLILRYFTFSRSR